MIMTFMCLMMKIFQYSSSTNGNKASGPPYKLKNAANGKAPSKIPRAIGDLGVNRGESGTEEPSKLAAAPKKRFHKLRKIRNKIRKFGRYDNSGTLPGSGQQITNADDSTTRSSQGGLMSMLNQKSADLNYNTMRSTDSLTSSQQNQLEFIQDNIDYQWFLDYGYRDGSSSLQRSSILSASCYDDLARDLDANLAHVDMEDFNHEDIHSLLHSLPPMCVRDIQERQGEMFASVSRSLLTSSSSKFPFSSSPSTSPLSSTEDPALSLVKSGPLFSPVKECSLPPAGTYSVDSLDCDEMMITCQHPNKHNYTIAFQGSTMMTSDTNESSDDNSKSQGCGVGGVTQPDKPKPKWMSELRGSGVSNPEMSNSDSPLTTWSKMKPTGGDGMLSRVPSGNNNSTPIGQTFDNTVLEFKPLQSACSVPSLLQSQSLPNLVSNKHQQWLLRNKLLALNSSINAAEKAFDVPIKIFDIEQSSSINSITDSIFSSSVVNSPRHSVASTPPPELSSNQNAPKKHTTTPSHQPNFSLLKLFIKQKNNLDNSVAATTHSVANNNNNENYMSWNEEGDTGAPCGEITNVNKCNVATWNTRPGGQNLNKQNYLATQHNGNYSFDSLTTATLENKMAEEDEGRVDNEEHLSVSQTSAGGSCYCDCGAGGHGPALSESTDSFSSHTNRPTVRAASAGPGGSSAGQSSQDTLSKDTESVAGRRMWHRAQCPMFDKSMQTSARNISASTNKTQSRSDASGGGGGKQVYVLYPNYTLPDLSFLQDHATELDLNNVFLWPQKFEPSPVCEQAPPLVCKETSGASRGRPMSCVDIDTLKRKGFSHVKDWSSLIYLLPREYTRILSDLPEIEAHLKSDAHLLEEVPVPLFCTKKRPVSCGDESTSSSNAPSSGYRGSSSILNEEAPSNNPLFIYRYDSISSESSMLQQTPPQLPKRQHSLSNNTDEGAPPRPPLPRSILRHPPHLEENIAKLKHGSKRFSMFEFGSKEDLAYDAASQPTTTTTHQQQVNKRASLPSNFINKKEGGGDHVWEDEGVEVGGTDSTISSEQVEDPAQRLEHLLEESGGPESWQKEDITTLRAQVIKFLNVTNKEAQQRKVVSFAQLNNLTTPPNSPNSATSNPNKLYQCKLQSGGITGVPIKEERESSPESKSDKTKSSVESIQKDLIEAVITSTRHLVNNFSSEQISNTSKIALNTLCPALYALLNEGLKPNLSTSFGDTPNSVWQVIEGSAQLGPSTKSLHELVLRLNSEQVLLSEGLLKFNAFLFGLLNVRGLDTWLSFLRTRETLLRRHYSESAILVSGCRGNATAKTLIDLLIGALGPLNSLPFKLDLLYEVRSLHESLSLLGKLPPISPIHSVSSSIGSLRTSWTLKKLIRSIQSSSEEESELTMGHIRPRSCIDSANYLSNDVASSAKKRWSTINMGSKLAVAFQSLGGEEDEYPDSLEPEPPVPPTSTTTTPPTLENKRLTAVTSDDNTSSDLSDLPDLSYTSEATSSGTRGGKFKRLQQRWEMLSGTPLQTPASSPVKVRSRIPRPVSSPTTVVKPSGLPLAKPMAKKPPLPSPTSTTPKSITPAPPRSKTEVLPSKMSLPKTEVLPSKITLPKSDLVTLPSKMSVPRTSRVDSVVSNPRPPVTRPSSLPYRKAVVGVERRAVSSSVVNRSVPQPQPPKYVKTLSHRLPSDNGHLSYNSGERLKVVLEVDDKWLLCCRGRQKGLVPRSAVILY